MLDNLLAYHYNQANCRFLCIFHSSYSQMNLYTYCHKSLMFPQYIRNSWYIHNSFRL